MIASPSMLETGDRARAELAPLIDLQMSSLGIAAMTALAPRRGQTVLDVGCGAGQTVLQLAELVGPQGHVIGVDIARQVLTVARERTAHLDQVTLMQADAADLPLDDKCVDGVFSRFGTMFFPDPIAAFSNFRRMLCRGGKICFICWRSMRENEIDVFPVRAAGLPVSAHDAPFSFEDATTIRSTLSSAGFERIRVDAHDEEVSCGDAEATLSVVTRVGALGMMLRKDPEHRPKILDAVRTALSAREQGGKVTLGVATWIVVATAP